MEHKELICHIAAGVAYRRLLYSAIIAAIIIFTTYILIYLYKFSCIFMHLYTGFYIFWILWYIFMQFKGVLLQFIRFVF